MVEAGPALSPIPIGTSRMMAYQTVLGDENYRYKNKIGEFI